MGRGGSGRHRLFIGAGAAGSGKRVALVEHDKIGGTCLNYGCNPTRTMLHIVNLLYRGQHVDQLGIDVLDV